MKVLLKIEELLMFILGIYLFSILDYKWWWFPTLILVPDIGMIGYLVSQRTGAITYNAFHHKGIAVACYLLGVYFQNNLLQLTGLMLFSHASIDRVFGYGLKYYDAFNNTHLGKIGKQ